MELRCKSSISRGITSDTASCLVGIRLLTCRVPTGEHTGFGWPLCQTITYSRPSRSRITNEPRRCLRRSLAGRTARDAASVTSLVRRYLPAFRFWPGSALKLSSAIRERCRTKGKRQTYAHTHAHKHADRDVVNYTGSGRGSNCMLIFGSINGNSVCIREHVKMLPCVFKPNGDGQRTVRHWYS